MPRLRRSRHLEIDTQPFRVCVRTGRETQQVPPLRYAPVGMTILLHGQVLLTEALAGTAELSSRPERSAVEGPAVSLPILTQNLGARVCRNVHLGKHCFGFDFDAPLGIEQRGDNHGGCGADLPEDFAVGAADGFPIFLVGNEHTGAVHMLQLRSCP